MGWAPCGRSLGHWYSVRERGTVFAFWNLAHNVGGGLTGLIAAYSTAWMGWRSAFYVPGILAILCAIYLIVRLRDTPQSVGLPPIEEYRNDYPEGGKRDREEELGTRELLVNYVLKNRYLWLFAAANFFVYIARYSMLDWGPTYLKEVKHASLEQGGFSTAIFEFAGMFSTVLMGWLSDKTGGRRGMISLLCMIPVFLAFGGILYTPPRHVVAGPDAVRNRRVFHLPAGDAAAGRRAWISVRRRPWARPRDSSGFSGISAARCRARASARWPSATDGMPRCMPFWPPRSWESCCFPGPGS